MQVTFFEQWVTFYPTAEDCTRHHWLEDAHHPITITFAECFKQVSAVFTGSAIEVPRPIPAELGGGSDWEVFPFKAGEATHEMLVQSQAYRIWSNYIFSNYFQLKYSFQ